jgi:serine/threonine protein kinase/tetratricopeptide (TPR) repeat protein
MGEVYKARDTRLNRLVALKKSKIAFDQRFQREAEAVAAINHPNVCTLFDIGPDYLIMEFVEGEELKGPLPFTRAIELACMILDGLDAAHGKGITHRDLKPANILMTKTGLKVMDFGLAKIASPELPAGVDDTTRAALTKDNTILGTLYYMAPEQLQGKQDVDSRADIFAFGCLLYELLTGKRAFDGSDTASVIAGVMQRPAPSVGDIAPAALDRVLRKCLAKDRSERYQSAGEVKRDLLRDLLRVTETTGDQASDAVPKPRRRLPLAIAGALAVLSVLGFVYWRAAPRGNIDSLAVLPFVNTGGGADADYLSDGITDSLIDDLSGLPNLKVMSHSAVFRYKGKETDPRTAGRELGVRAVLTGRLIQRGNDLSIRAELVNVDDDASLWGEQYNRNLKDALAVQQDISRQIVDRLKVRLSSAQMSRIARRQTDNPEAYQLYLKGRFYAAKFDPENLNRGREYLRQAIALDPGFALAWDGLAYYYALLLDWFEPSNDVGPKALEAARKALELDPDLVEAHVELGSLHMFYTFDWASAEREYKRALELNPSYAPAHEYYAWLLIGLGHREEGLAEIRRAEQLDPLSVEIGFEEGSFLILSRRYAEALIQLNKARELDPDQWATYYEQGQALEQLGRAPEALAALKKSEQILGANPSPPLAEEARVYALTGRRDEAMRALDRLLALAQKTQVSKYAVATVYAALGDKDQAFARLNQAYEEHSFLLDFVKVDPELDPLRADPRFHELVRKMNFPN